MGCGGLVGDVLCLVFLLSLPCKPTSFLLDSLFVYLLLFLLISVGPYVLCNILLQK